MAAEYRVEKDSLGEVRVPEWAKWGAQTQRAVENFPVSGIRFPRRFIQALGLIKQAAAKVNEGLGQLDGAKAKAIARAAEEVAEGKWDDHFPLDVFQTGSGTSTNMNANEVIAHRAAELLGEAKAVHPNDHVNLGQSSNDVIPTAVYVSARLAVDTELTPALKHLAATLEQRGQETLDVVKTGRTHLMDAMPITLGQELEGWAYQVAQSIERIEDTLPRISQLAIGGTAVGTGINTHAEFGRRVAEELTELTGLAFAEAPNHFAAQSSMDAGSELSGQLKTTATALLKIANDLRWMNSGPIAGLGEVALPALQPGSSIMPAKVNPVICEATIMACGQVIANDTAVTIANERGNFQLNCMFPLMAHNLLQSVTLLANVSTLLADKAVATMTVNEERMASFMGKNPILVTALAPEIGYDKASEIGKRAYREGRPVKEVAREMTSLDAATLDRLLDPRAMTHPDGRE